MSALPAGPFGCIYADPPWRFKTWSEKGDAKCPDGLSQAQARKWWRNKIRESRPHNHYSTMSLADICAMPVSDAAAKDSVLILWVVGSMIPEALQVGAAWGFTFKTDVLWWVKGREAFSPNPSLGYWSRKQGEQCFLFTRGKPKRVSKGVEQIIYCPRGAHSAKPDETYERIEALVGGPYLELFARSQRPGWSAWGNQVGVRDGSLNFEAAA